jgi:uncharacterized membrane protein
MRTSRFLHQLDHDRIVAAIREAEARSRGEVRVHVTNQQPADVQKAAATQFERLGMTATALRNGVLIYVAPPVQQFAVIGDLAIHERGGPGFWAAVAQAMEEDFRAGRFTEGIVKGVTRVGEALATHFPRIDAPDANELSDQVTED